MKGEATIQLFDARTGKEKQRITEENLITNFYKKLIEDYLSFWQIDAFSTNLQYFLGYWTPKQTSSGIILLDTAQPEDPDNIMLSGGKCVGHAGAAYSGASAYRGNLNASESGNIVDGVNKVIGYQWVWDFATDKANGTIKCACLTTERGGNRGYKEDESPNDYSAYAFDPNSQQTSLSLDSIDKYFIGMDPTDKTFYFQQSLSGTIYLRKWKVPSLGAIAYNDKLKLFVDANDVRTITLPSSEYLFLDLIDGGLYGLQYNRSTKALVLKKFNKDTLETSATWELTNSNQLYYSSPNFAKLGDYVYALSNSSSPRVLYKYSLINGQCVDEIALPSNSITMLTTFDDKFISLGYYDSSNKKASYWLYDGTNFHGKFIDYGSSSNCGCPKRLGKTPFVSYAQQYSRPSIQLALFGPCFFSVNNLASPVVKTDSDTMKVTYRITW